jgi:hypothetical protein
MPQAVAAAEPAIEQRVRALEERLQRLGERVETLERAASASARSAEATAPSTDGISWTFQEYVNDSPFKVTYKSFDRRSGAVELLLEVTAAVPQPHRWSEPGRRVPLVLTYRAGDGTETTTGFTLLRLSSLEPGSRVHVRAELDPDQAAAASHLRIGKAGD